MKEYVLFVAASVALASCVNNQKPNAETPATAVEASAASGSHTAETSLDYQGVYEGTLPAASCPGIKTKLSIHKDATFDLHTEYIGEKEGVFDDRGTYTIEGNVLTTNQNDGTVSYYKVEEGQIRMLNAEKQPVTGELADSYVLKQAQTL